MKRFLTSMIILSALFSTPAEAMFSRLVGKQVVGSVLDPKALAGAVRFSSQQVAKEERFKMPSVRVAPKSRDQESKLD